jgi:PTS system nitrogen regulatory IIA component
MSRFHALHGAAWAETASTRNSRSICNLGSDFAFGSEGIPLYSPGAPDDLGEPAPQPLGRWARRRVEATELLGEQDVVLRLPAKGKRSALARIAAHLGEKVEMSQGAVLAAMLRRERLGSTAIGYGVAIPHARLEDIPEPQAMLTTLQRPVWFDAPDEEPVDLLLAVVWPKADSAGFLQALAHFCRLLRYRELRDRIRAAETPAEALTWVGTFQERIAAIRYRAH